MISPKPLPENLESSDVSDETKRKLKEQYKTLTLLS